MLVYLLFGVLGGVLSGLLGVGGGIIFIPVFDHIFRSHGIEGEELVRYILANSFLAILFAGLSSSLKHWRMGNFHLREVLTIAFPAMVTGVSLSTWITHATWYKETYFKLVFMGVILYTLWRTWVNNRKEATVEELPYSSTRYSLIGLATGFISAVSGLGGGVAMIPLLTMWARLDIRKASAISISVIPIMILPFLLIYALGNPTSPMPYQWGYLQFLFTAPVVLGIFIGSPLGVRWGQQMKSSNLQRIFAGLLILLVIKYVYELIAGSF